MFSCFLQARKMDVWTWTSKTVYSSVYMMVFLVHEEFFPGESVKFGSVATSESLTKKIYIELHHPLNGKARKPKRAIQRLCIHTRSCTASSKEKSN